MQFVAMPIMGELQNLNFLHSVEHSAGNVGRALLPVAEKSAITYGTNYLNGAQLQNLNFLHSVGNDFKKAGHAVSTGAKASVPVLKSVGKVAAPIAISLASNP